MADEDEVDLGAEDALELDLSDDDSSRQWYRRRLTRVLYVSAAAFAGLALGVVLAFVYIANASKDSRAATCAVIATNREEKRQQLQQYAESPPPTELGRKLQQTYKESEAAWEQLWSTLGCKEAAPPGP